MFRTMNIVVGDNLA